MIYIERCITYMDHCVRMYFRNFNRKLLSRVDQGIFCREYQIVAFNIYKIDNWKTAVAKIITKSIKYIYIYIYCNPQTLDLDLLHMFFGLSMILRIIKAMIYFECILGLASMPEFLCSLY